MPKSDKPRKKRSVRIKLDLQQWVNEQVSKKRFQNFSHAVDVALEKLRDSEKERKTEKIETGVSQNLPIEVNITVTTKDLTEPLRRYNVENH